MAIRSINPKGPINLGLGDPTGLHAPPPASISAVVETIQKGQDNGYIPGPGTVQAREAIAAYHKRWDGVSYTAGEVALVRIPHCLRAAIELTADARCRTCFGHDLQHSRHATSCQHCPIKHPAPATRICPVPHAPRIVGRRGTILRLRRGKQLGDRSGPIGRTV